MLAQLPGGWLQDRFGTRRIYGAALFAWSLMTLLQGFTPAFGIGAAIVALFVLRIAVGVAEAPAFPANGRVVATWFPDSERATASSIFNAAQYAAPVVFTPLMAYLTQGHGWPIAYFVMGTIGMVVGFAWFAFYRAPRDHWLANDSEIDHIATGGGLVDMESSETRRVGARVGTWGCLRVLLTSRMMLGVYIGQFFITTLVYFFLTWFPIYLVQGLGMNLLEAGFVAALPALCGFIGGILGGLFSDLLLRKGMSLTRARKIPIVAGLVMTTSIVACAGATSESFVVAVMALAFFGKGFGSLGWTVVSDTSPKEASGLAGGLFNTFANLAGITTPIVIGYIVDITGSFDGALVFVGVSGALAALSFLVVVPRIERIDLASRAQTGEGFSA
jgi:D-galactonate transporter